MKTKKIFFFITLLIAIYCIACSKATQDQPETEHASGDNLPDSAYVYYVGSDGKETLSQITYYTYDPEGNLVMQRDTVLQENAITTINRTEMEYNAKGLLTEHREYAYTMGNWINKYCYQYTYDEYDRLEQMVIYEYFSNPVSSVPNRKYHYTWSNDAHAECLTYNINGGLDGRIEYTYNAYRKVEKVVSYRLKEGITTEWVLNYSQTYEYDQYENLTIYILYDQENAPKISETCSYEYDRNGKILVAWSSFYDSYTDSQKNTKSVYYY